MKKNYSQSSNNLELGLQTVASCINDNKVISIPSNLHNQEKFLINSEVSKPILKQSQSLRRTSFALTKNQKYKVDIQPKISDDEVDDVISSTYDNKKILLKDLKYSEKFKNINNAASNKSPNGSKNVSRTVHEIVKANMSWSPTTTRDVYRIRPRLYSSQCHKPMSRNAKVKQWIEGRYKSINLEVYEDDPSNNDEKTLPKKPLRRVRRNLEDIIMPMEKLAKAKSSFDKNDRTVHVKMNNVTSRNRTRKVSRSTARRRRNRTNKSALVISSKSETISSESKSINHDNIADINSENAWSHQSQRDFKLRRLVSIQDKLNAKGQPVLLLNYLERGQTNEALKLAKEGASRVRIDVCLLWTTLNGDVDLMKFFIAHGALVEARDAEGFSALHFAAASGSVKAADVLIMEGVRTCGQCSWDNRSEYTPLMIAALNGFVDIISLLLRHGANIDAGLHERSVTALHHAVRSGATDSVQSIINGGATINPLQLYSETPLHIAVEEGYSDIVEVLLKAGADVRASRGHLKTTSLHISAQGNYYHISHQLLKAGADPNQENSNGKSPLHLAAKSQCFDTVQILLNYKANPNAKDSDGRTALHSGIFKGSRNFECLRLILENDGDPNTSDLLGYTPLHLAALNDSMYCVKLFLKHGGDLTKTTKGGVTALNIIMRRTPAVITHIQESFNNAVTYLDIEQQYERDGQIQLDFRVLLSGSEGGPECRLMSCLIQEGQKTLLRHPLCETFLYLKWLRVRSFFVFNVFFYMILVMTMTQYYYMALTNTSYYFDEAVNKSTNVKLSLVPNSTDTLSISRSSVEIKYEIECQELTTSVFHIRLYILYFMWFLLIILTIKESFQVLDSPRTYLSSLDNILIWPVIIGAVITSVTIHSLELICPWHYHVAALVTLCSWFELMLLVGRFPSFGLYIHMFGQVTKNFGKFILTYICLINAFSTSFGILFHNQPPFKQRLLCLLKTLVMMTGEIEFDEWFYESKDTKERILYFGTSHFVFALFLMFGTIVLMNLLVGLAVSDIQGLQKSAGLDRLVRQTELIAHFETFMFSQWLTFLIPLRLSKFLHKRVLLLNTMYGNKFILNTKNISSSHLPQMLIENIKRLARNRNHYSYRRNAFADFRTLSNTLQLSTDVNGDLSGVVDAIRCGIEVLMVESEDHQEQMTQINENLANLSILIKDSLTRNDNNRWSLTDQDESYFMSCKSGYNAHDSNTSHSTRK